MADDRDSLLREVEEEIRREQMQKLWDRYNGLIIGAAALIVIGVGGYKFLESRRIAASQAAGAEFAKALQLSEDKKDEDAAKAFDTIAQSGPAGYAQLAKLNVAGAHARAGKTAEAIAAYESISAQSGGDALLKNYAQLQVAALKLGEGDYTEQQNRLKPLATDDSPFKITARELQGLSAFKAGKLAEARQYLEPLLIDQNASRAIQERVKIVMAEITRAEVGSAPAASVPAASTDAGKPADAAPAATTPATTLAPADGKAGAPEAAKPATDAEKPAAGDSK
ncbi:MAG: tetratricopeptide repeat protein [Hyphomicrobium sp.]|nr:tetratricopeptide repeat protein [Hyphomicrobium sp.]